MDFWSRLIGGAGAAAQKRQSTPNNPQQRLARFKRTYNQILTTLHKSSALASDAAALETIRICFQRLASILYDEARSPAPHLCLSFAASGQIYLAISRIGSAAARNEGVVKQAVAVFGALVDSEEEELLANKKFADALMAFVNRVSDVGILGEDTGAEVVELLFGIAAKIRMQPEILPVWFNSKVPPDEQLRSQKIGFAGVTQKGDFPLCYQLIDRVYHEGPVGDFSRTGLLYIFESASHSANLEQWIVESDLPTLMASGLGALYSQLSRKLSIIHLADDVPLILALSDYQALRSPSGSVNLFSQEFRTHMDTFLSHLTFWQDALEHCESVDVRQTLVDHFQVLFLQQLLYPSLLESSDTDGGSSVAVLTYLRHILNVLNHPELVHMILHYLLAVPETAVTKRPKTPRSPSTARRRMSLLLLTAPEKEEDRPNPALFNLVDLILNSIHSSNAETVVVALKLVTVILDKNHAYALGTLVQAFPKRADAPSRMHGALNAELESYLSLAEDIGGRDGLDEAYDSHLEDGQILLETHTCNIQKSALSPLDGRGSRSSFDKQLIDIGRSVRAHSINPDDQLFKLLLRTLQTFLTNDVEINLALTETTVTLVSCSHLCLEGWLAVDPSKYQFRASGEEDRDMGSEALRNVYHARRRPYWHVEHTPALLQVFGSLRQQILDLKNEITDFDLLLANRKEIFRLQTKIGTVERSAQPFAPTGRPSLEASRDSSGRHPGVPALPTVPNYIHPRPRTPSPARSRSPASGAPAANSRYMPISPPRTAQPLMQRINVESPTKRDKARTLSPASVSMQSVGGTSLGESVRSQSGKRRNDAEMKRLREMIAFPLDSSEMSYLTGSGRTQSATGSATGTPTTSGTIEDIDVAAPATGKSVSLSHVLTNVVILQEFVLELAAILQVRATLFEEVRFA